MYSKCGGNFPTTCTYITVPNYVPNVYRFLVDMKWWSQWEAFVYQDGSCPGAICNRKLLLGRYKSNN